MNFGPDQAIVLQHPHLEFHLFWQSIRSCLFFSTPAPAKFLRSANHSARNSQPYLISMEITIEGPHSFPTEDSKGMCREDGGSGGRAETGRIGRHSNHLSCM